MIYSDRVTAAFELANRLHRDQRRKGSDVPYITHLMGVASLVGEFGGGEDQVIAALLHDAVEDQGGVSTLERIRSGFGDCVAGYVEGCTDAYTEPKPPWESRKRAFIESLQGAPEALQLIVAADKLHNLRTMVSDYRETGEALWERFTKGRDGVLWYHGEVLAALEEGWDHPILRELRSVYERLQRDALG